MRKTTIARTTSETNIQIQLNIDGQGTHNIQTGISFFDHMLTQIAVHGLCDLEIRAKGDLEIDSHHTIEDVAIALGQAFNEALGDKKGIIRMAHSVVPMDESLCEVTLDLSGRPYCIFTGEWTGILLGGIPVTLIEHFFYSFSMNLQANLHAHIRYGRDDHHKAEALFKALARGLHYATRIDLSRSDSVPSSKGVL